jgi:ATP phosphoribosyltransferase
MPFSIAVPNKGRLCDETLQLLRRTGLRVTAPDSRLFESFDGGKVNVLFVRAQDIPGYVASGSVDLGVTGRDLVEELGVEVESMLDLGYGRCRLVLARPQAGKGAAIAPGARVATPFPNLTRRFLQKIGVEAQIIPVSGATEITPYLGVADYIVDLVQTGSTLREHNLTAVETILESTAILIANPKSGKLREALDFVEAVRSVLAASKRRYLMANVHEKEIERVTRLLPGLSAPTVMKLSREGMYAIHAVVDESGLNTLLADLKREGASGILILPIERMVP